MVVVVVVVVVVVAVAVVVVLQGLYRLGSQDSTPLPLARLTSTAWTSARTSRVPEKAWDCVLSTMFSSTSSRCRNTSASLLRSVKRHHVLACHFLLGYLYLSLPASFVVVVVVVVLSTDLY